MKKMTLIAALFTGFSAFAQNKVNIPAAPKVSFAKNFPGALEAKWGKENANYEVDFILNAKKMSAEYDEKGTLIETDLIITAAELPAPVMLYMNQHYKGISITEIDKVTKPNGEISYEVDIKGKDIFFDLKGKFIKEVKD